MQMKDDSRTRLHWTVRSESDVSRSSRCLSGPVGQVSRKLRSETRQLIHVVHNGAVMWLLGGSVVAYSDASGPVIASVKAHLSIYLTFPTWRLLRCPRQHLPKTHLWLRKPSLIMFRRQEISSQ